MDANDSNISDPKDFATYEPIRPGSYITPDVYSSGKEADTKLALPKDKFGNDRIPKYRYTFYVKPGEYAGAPNSLPNNIVAPYDNKAGGGTEYINIVPLIPANCVEIE